MKSPEPGTVLPIPYMRVGQLFFDGRYITEVGLDEWSQLGYEQAYLGFKSFLSGWDAYAIYELNILVQDDTDYLKIKQRLGDKFLGGPNIRDNDQTYYEFTLAFLFNNYSKYMVPNALRTPEEFWLMQGKDQYKVFLDAKSDAIKYLRNIAQ
jgi:hypothetical protein